MTKRKIAVFDIDGTIFRSGLYREVIFELLRTKKIPAEARRIFSDEELNWKMRKSDEAFVQYEDKMVTILHQHLPQLKTADYEAASRRVVQKMGNHCYVFTRNLVRKLTKQNYYLIAISGSPQEVVTLFAEQLKFNLAIGADYKRDGKGYYTGQVGTPTWRNKEKILQKALNWNNFTMKDSYAVGDTMGDASLLATVDNPIAFNPQKELFELAKANGWRVVLERKNMIYHLEPTDGGYQVKC